MQHPDCTRPESRQAIHEHFADMPGREMLAVIGGNTAGFHGRY